MRKPKILLYDIETAPILAHVWGLYDERVGLNQIIQDTHLLSWSAKWLDSDKVMYMDQRKEKDITNDKKLVKELKKVIDEADVIVTHNGKSFDEKVVNARLLVNGLQPLFATNHVDTYAIAKNKFRLTSNKLEYIAKVLKVKHQKYTNRKFVGHDLWKECLKGNVTAWKEMEKYNKTDTLVLQSVYLKLRAWDTTFNPLVYTEDAHCECGCKEFINNGVRYTKIGQYQRASCKRCGKSYRGKTNLLKPDRRKSMLTT